MNSSSMASRSGWRQITHLRECRAGSGGVSCPGRGALMLSLLSIVPAWYHGRKEIASEIYTKIRSRGLVQCSTVLRIYTYVEIRRQKFGRLIAVLGSGDQRSVAVGRREQTMLVA